MTNLARALNINGWMSEPELLYLANIASKSNKIIEVGCYRGRSTRVLADNTNGIIHAIDPWDGKYQVYGSETYPDLAYQSFHQNGTNEIYSQFYSNLYHPINNGKVVVHRMNFENFQSDEKFDFIFLDAIHEYEALKNDIKHALTLMTSGTLAGHDYCDAWPAVIKIVNELFPNRTLNNSIWSIQI